MIRRQHKAETTHAFSRVSLSYGGGAHPAQSRGDGLNAIQSARRAPSS